MNRTRNIILGLMMTALFGAVSAQGQVIRGVNDAQVRNLMQRIETRTDNFRVTMDRQMDNNNRIDGTRTEDSIMEFINRFENATDELRDSYNSRRSTAAEATTVMNYAWYVDDFMRRNRLSANVENQWNLIRNDLNTLSRYYSVSWNWNRTAPPYQQNFPTANVSVNATQMTNLLRRLETRTNAFRSSVDRRIDNTGMDGTRTEESVMDYVNRFENATNILRNSFNSRRATAAEVTEVLNYGWYVDDFMRRNQTMAARNRFGANVVNQWTLIRGDLNSLAGYYNVAWNWNRTTPPYGQNFPTGPNYPVQNVNTTQMTNLLRRLETRTDTFRSAVDRRVDNTRINGTSTEDSIMEFINRFEGATDELRNSFNSRNATAAEVTAVLNYGWYVDDFMRRNQSMTVRNRLGANVVNQWNLIRGDLNSLAGYYNVAWNWNRTTPPYGTTFPGGGGNSMDSRFTGTYRLNSAMSDNVADVINRAFSGSNDGANRQRQNLERRLSSPQNLAIEKNGNQVILATNLYSPVTLVADGRVSSETNARGVTTRTSITMTGNTLTMNTEGDRANDFWVSFTPISGNRIQMTRRIYIENRNQQITVSSIYDRVSNSAQWPSVDRSPGYNSGTTGQVGTFYIPNGTRLTAVLRNRIATNVSQAGDQFEMEVTSPNQYQGAIIMGRIMQAESSGRVSGRANLAMEFNSIRYGNQTYQFAGIIDSAREADGDEISINNEGTVRDGNQTTRTVTRAGIGAALGALIGAIVSGGDGAAIGAGIGAGAGAGTVLIQGRDNLNLEAGSQFEITATGPNNNSVGRNW